MAVIRSESLPWSWSRAAFKLSSARAETTSMTASASLRSILPLRKALLVNSPGSAGRAPVRLSRYKIRATVRLPPWQLSSSMSSPV